MEVNHLINERTDQEVEARLRRRREMAVQAAARAAAREAEEAEHVSSLQAQTDKWTIKGVLNANSYDLKDPVVAPLGSFLSLS